MVTYSSKNTAGLYATSRLEGDAHGVIMFNTNNVEELTIPSPTVFKEILKTSFDDPIQKGQAVEPPAPSNRAQKTLLPTSQRSPD